MGDTGPANGSSSQGQMDNQPARGWEDTGLGTERAIARLKREGQAETGGHIHSHR